MNVEMNNTDNNNKRSGMSVTRMVMKTLENAAKEYARGCIRECASLYGFDSDEAEGLLNLENCVIEVKEKKRRGEKKVSEKKVSGGKVKRARFPLPFVGIEEGGCEGLAYNCGLFTQCEKRRVSGRYCRGCQGEADASESGEPKIGTVSGRMAVGMMEFRDGKGRMPIEYRKIMAKNGVSREEVELEASELNLRIDEVHFAEVEDKKKGGKAGRPKAGKKNKIVTVYADAVEDLFGELVDDEDMSITSTLMDSDREEEEEEDRQTENEKVLRGIEQGLMKEEDTEMKKIVKSEKKADELIIKAQLKETLRSAKAQQLIADKELKAQQLIADKELKAQQLIADKELKAQQLIADKELKAQQLIADKELKAQQLIADKELKEAKAQQLIADKEALRSAKAQQLIADKELKAQQLIADKLKEAKAQQLIVDKEAKAQQLIVDKAAKAQQLIADKELKAQQLIADKEAQRSAKAQQLIADKLEKEYTKAAELIAKSDAKAQKLNEVKASKEKKAVKTVTVKAEKAVKTVTVKAVNTVTVPEAAEKEAPKKVTVKRITIDGIQYLKTADNLLYNPDTREEMGIYDAETNTIKVFADEDDDEIEEDGYSSNEN